MSPFHLYSSWHSLHQMFLCLFMHEEKMISQYSGSVWYKQIKTWCLLCSSWSIWRSNLPLGTRSLGSCRCYTSATPPTLWASTGLSTVMEKSVSAWSIWYFYLIFYGSQFICAAFTLSTALQTAESVSLSVDKLTFIAVHHLCLCTMNFADYISVSLCVILLVVGRGLPGPVAEEGRQNPRADPWQSQHCCG